MPRSFKRTWLGISSSFYMPCYWVERLLDTPTFLRHSRSATPQGTGCVAANPHDPSMEVPKSNFCEPSTLLTRLSIWSDVTYSCLVLTATDCVILHTPCTRYYCCWLGKSNFRYFVYSSCQHIYVWNPYRRSGNEGSLPLCRATATSQPFLLCSLTTVRRGINPSTAIATTMRLTFSFFTCIRLSSWKNNENNPPAHS